MERVRSGLASLRASIIEIESQSSNGGKGRHIRRMEARANSWRTDETAYSQALAAIDRLASAELDRRPAPSAVIPKRLIGERNSIHQLQNYVVAIAPEGLQLAPDGTLDQERSFRRIDYFALLAGLSVRNVVQERVGSRPLDFLAVRISSKALPPARSREGEAAFGVWLYGGEDRQLIILARNDPLQLRVVPVARLREDSFGRIQFERQDWRAGLPLELVEDDNFGVPDTERARWLSEWHSEREWLRASHRTRYSNAVIGLYEHFHPAPSGELGGKGFHWARRALVEPDLLVLARDHWNLNVRGFNAGGNHGSFFRISTHSVLMMAGGPATGLKSGLVVDEPYDSLSFVPTILALMGRCEPDLPGPLIREVGHMPCVPH
jgi:hypothetical protein